MEPETKIVPIKPDTPKKNAKSVPPSPGFLFKYVIGLLFVALVLVFLSYMAHMQRQSEEDWAEAQKQQTQFSVSALQSIEKLQQENATLTQNAEQDALTMSGLRAEIDAMRAARAALKAELARTEEDAKAQLAEQAAQAAESEAALNAFWQLERLMALHKYTAARAFVADMEAAGYPALLPDTASDVLDTTPREEWDRIKDTLGV